MPRRPLTSSGAGITFISPFAASSTPLETPRDSPRTDTLPSETSLVIPLVAHIKAQDAERRRSIATTCFRPSRVGMKESRKSQDTDSRCDTPLASREALFGDHLSAILNHSLSLCSASDAAGLSIAPYSPPLTPLSSPRSSASESQVPPSSPGTSSPKLRIQRLPSLPSISVHNRWRLIDMLQTWDFDAHELDDDELWECAAIIFECVLGMEGVKTGVDFNRIRALLISLRAAYHARNAYHNFMHATDVLQALYSFLVAFGVAPPLSTLLEEEKVWTRDPEVDRPGGIGELLRPMDVFALLVAGIGHDVGHPGLSNAYMVNARTPVAQVYGGKSCLENFHSVTLVHMLKKHGFAHLSESNNNGIESDFRQVLMASVLATDMSSHFPIVAKLQEAARRFESGAPRSQEQIMEDRLLICGCLMKCADISNPSRPHEIARAWSSCLLEEWAEQARIEAEFKLPISVVTLNPAEKRAQAKSQVGFINLFTQPLFDGMAAACPAFAPFAAHCRAGRRIWEQVVLDVPEPSSSPLLAPPPIQPRYRTAPSSFAAALHQSGKRSAPPKPLVFSNGSRGSVDSSTSGQSLSPFSPLFVRRGHNRTQSTSTVATDVEDLDLPLSARISPMPSTRDEFSEECDGSCVNVTARCETCMRKEQESRATPTFAQESFQRDWPPLPFCPTLVH